MKFIHTQKYIRISPTKVRPVVEMIREMPPEEAIEKLPYITKRGALPIEKVLKAAVANAKEQGVQVQDLKIEEIQVGDGPRIKRGRPVSRGRSHPIIKRMCHIRVVLVSIEKEKVKKGKVKKVSKSKNVKTNISGKGDSKK